MKIRFAHIADVHLGNQQYGLPERFDDFGRSWLDAVEQCIAQSVVFVVIAGDFFEKRSIEPRALVQAREGLRQLRRANIPVIAVEGNHDRPLYREGMSWMEFLDMDGDLRLLSPIIPGETGLHYRPHQRGEGGSYVDVGGVRVVGQPYLGAMAGRVLEQMATHLRLEGRGDAEYVIYLCHAGLEGIVPRASGCLTAEEWDGIVPWVDYVALGHIHQRFEHEDRLFNPGSLEARGSDEAAHERGFYIVDIDTNAHQKHHVQHFKSWSRPWILLSLLMDTCDSPAALEAELVERLREQNLGMDDKPLVEIKLSGRLGFDSSLLNPDTLTKIVREHCAPLHIVVHNQVRPADAPLGEELEETLSRDQIEQRVLTECFAKRSDYKECAADWSRLASEIKTMALQAKPDSATLLAALSHRAGELTRQEANSDVH